MKQTLILLVMLFLLSSCTTNLNQTVNQHSKFMRTVYDPNNKTIESMPAVVVNSFPQSGDTSVDPDITELRVTFSKDMRTRGWAWCRKSEDTFPEGTGGTHYLDDKRTCIFPVKLQPGKSYVVLINAWSKEKVFDAFKDQNGLPAFPYVLTFETRK